jgi:hypothetical protein
MIKKYNQFVKGKINEDFELDYPEVDEPRVETTLLDEPELSNEFEGEEEEEEEAGDKYETALRKLADAAGVEFKSGDKSIVIDGKEVTFPAEDEKYHIKGVKKAFTSVEDVMVNINNSVSRKLDRQSGEEQMEMPKKMINGMVGQEQMEMPMNNQFESNSYKYKRFKK